MLSICLYSKNSRTAFIKKKSLDKNQGYSLNKRLKTIKISLYKGLLR